MLSKVGNLISHTSMPRQMTVDELKNHQETEEDTEKLIRQMKLLIKQRKKEVLQNR